MDAPAVVRGGACGLPPGSGSRDRRRHVLRRSRTDTPRHHARRAVRGAGGRAVRRARLSRRRARRPAPPGRSCARDAAGAAGCSLFEVPDTLRAFGQLARARRRRARRARSSRSPAPTERPAPRRCSAAVLRTRYRTHATRANLNNLVGVPLTILEAPADTEALVVEAGANLPGEIARYREIIEPSITVVTNAVAGTPRRLRLAGGRGGGEARRSPTACRSPSSARDRRRSRPGRRRPRAAGADGGARERGPDPGPGRPRPRSPRPVVTFGDDRFTLAARGLHQADNATRVWAVVEALGPRPRRRRRAALERFAIPGGRGELLEAGRSHHSQRLLQRQSAELPRGNRDGAGAPEAAGGWSSSPGRCASSGRMRRRCTRRSPTALVELEPDLLGGRRGIRAGARALCRAARRPAGHARRTPCLSGPLIASRLTGTRSSCSRHPAAWPSNVYFRRSRPARPPRR